MLFLVPSFLWSPLKDSKELSFLFPFSFFGSLSQSGPTFLHCLLFFHHYNIIPSFTFPSFTFSSSTSFQKENDNNISSFQKASPQQVQKLVILSLLFCYSPSTIFSASSLSLVHSWSQLLARTGTFKSAKMSTSTLKFSSSEQPPSKLISSSKRAERASPTKSFSTAEVWEKIHIGDFWMNGIFTLHSDKQLDHIACHILHHDSGISLWVWDKKDYFNLLKLGASYETLLLQMKTNEISINESLLEKEVAVLMQQWRTVPTSKVSLSPSEQ